MAKMRMTEYTVVGTGPFPTDMLRYDTSYPADGDSAIGILSQAGFMEKREMRRVTLRHRDVYAGWNPTAGRWESFLWAVDQNSVRRWDS